MNVLFLSISMGAGHIKAADALREYILLRYPKSKTLIIDTFKYINPLTHKLVVDGYLSTVRTSPKIYGGIYRLSECKENVNRLSKAFSEMLAPKIHKLVQEFNPSIIVCTHPFPLQMIAHLKKQNKIKVPAVAILTDFVNHPSWFHDNIEAYIVAHDYIKRDMEACGIPKNRIFSYGIPVSPVFLKHKPKTMARKELSLDNKLTMLLVGGSLGIGDIENTFLSFAMCPRDMQIIAVAGKNTALKEKLERLSKSYKKPIRVFGYTDKICELMDASDFIVTKPGGMTISEALIKKLPALIISPIPGQEERNASFIINSGTAVRITKNDNIDSILCQVFDNSLRYEHMREMAGHLSKPDSGHNILRLMENLINDNRNGLLKYSFYTL